MELLRDHLVPVACRLGHDVGVVAARTGHRPPVRMVAEDVREVVTRAPSRAARLGDVDRVVRIDLTHQLEERL